MSEDFLKNSLSLLDVKRKTTVNARGAQQDHKNLGGTQAEWIVSEPTERKRGRPVGYKPIPKEPRRMAMTGAERSRHYRDKRRLQKKLIIPPPDPKPIGNLAQATREDTVVRRFIDHNFPHLRDLAHDVRTQLSKSEECERPVFKNKYLYMFVGTAIDYRIRIYFGADAHRSPAIKCGLLLLKSLDQFGRRFVNSFDRFLTRTNAQRRLLSFRDEEKLCRYCALLAHIDAIGRSPPFLGLSRNPSFEWIADIANMNVDKILDGAAEISVIEDLIALSTKFYNQNRSMLHNFKHVVAGATLSGSRDVRGADFDMLVDRCLYGVKTTINPRDKVLEHLRQLIGYWLLDYEDCFKMQSAAIYFSRQGFTRRFDFRGELLATNRRSEDIRAEFRECLRKADAIIVND